MYLNAIANQLRYPNSHTHYFSCTLLYLFAEANSEAIQEQITRLDILYYYPAIEGVNSIIIWNVYRKYIACDILAGVFFQYCIKEGFLN